MIPKLTVQKNEIGTLVIKAVGPQGAKGEKGDAGDGGGTLPWDSITDKPDTDEIPEGAENLYHTAARVAEILANTNVGGALSGALLAPGFSLDMATQGELDTEKLRILAVENALPAKADLVGGLVPGSQLPSYVDDVEEFAALVNFPNPGESGKIYTATSTNKIYRWTGSAYIEIVGSPGSSDEVAEGVTNLYFTVARVRDTVLSGLSLAASSAISVADSVLSALGKLQAQITALADTVAGKASQTSVDAKLTIPTATIYDVIDGTGATQSLYVAFNLMLRNILNNPDWTLRDAGAGGANGRWQFLQTAATATSARQTSSPPPGATRYLRITQTGGSANSFVSQRISTAIPLSWGAGQSVVFSMYARRISGLNPIPILSIFRQYGPGIVETNLGASQNLTDSWTRYEWTATMPGTAPTSWLELYFIVPTGTLVMDIGRCQLELGSAATAFTESPLGFQLGA